MKPLKPYEVRVLKTLGLQVESYSPGDGVTRYKLVPDGTDYWEAQHSYPIFLGRKELEAAISALLIVTDLGHLPTGVISMFSGKAA